MCRTRLITQGGSCVPLNISNGVAWPVLGKVDMTALHKGSSRYAENQAYTANACPCQKMVNETHIAAKRHTIKRCARRRVICKHNDGVKAAMIKWGGANGILVGRCVFLKALAAELE